MASNRTVGRRVYPDGNGVLQLVDGDYGVDPINGHWMGQPPGAGIVDLSDHVVTEGTDATITVSGSITVTLYANTYSILWNGYLERGVWTEV